MRYHIFKSSSKKSDCRLSSATLGLPQIYAPLPTWSKSSAREEVHSTSGQVRVDCPIHPGKDLCGGYLPSEVSPQAVDSISALAGSLYCCDKLIK